MIAYDVLSFDKRTGRHEVLDRRGTAGVSPGSPREGLAGAAVFTDGQVEYAERLCVEVAVAAVGDGAEVRTKARVEEPILEGGRVVGVRYRDTTHRRPARGARSGRAERGRPLDRPHLPRAAPPSSLGSTAAPRAAT